MHLSALRLRPGDSVRGLPAGEYGRGRGSGSDGETVRGQHCLRSSQKKNNKENQKIKKLLKLKEKKGKK